VPSAINAARRAAAVVAVIVVAAVAGCDARSAAPDADGTPAPSASRSPVETASPQPSASPSRSPSASPSASRTGTRYVFPVRGNASYAHTHEGYPASDIMAACGTGVVAVTNGVVLEAQRVDLYDPKVDAGATRGGIFVSILGDDGVRYYGAHFTSIKPGIAPGARVTAGMPIAVVGSTGNSGACHVHFAISPPCARTGDWYNRRGLIYPWPYLDSWRAGGSKSPVAEVRAWQARNGCPTRPLVLP
jgi:murein DD-endopeptidase MepM/ murein hydrolase activator NlpD